MRDRSAALVVIGNEILSGKIRDSNAYFAARFLREIGVELRRIVTVPDELEIIAEEIAFCTGRFEVVITSGGVGPTHDDVTMEGVARAFGRELVSDPRLVRLITERSGEQANAAMLKMAQTPAGAVLNDAGDVRFPTVQVENVYVLPGIPELFEHKLRALKPRLSVDPYFIRVVYTALRETALAEHLDATLLAYPKLLLGSYPRTTHCGYRVKLTLESKDRDYLENALAYLLRLLPRDTVVKVE